MNVDKKTQTIPVEPVSELSDSSHEIQTSSSQFVTSGKK